jgi:transposase
MKTGRKPSAKEGAKGVGIRKKQAREKRLGQHRRHELLDAEWQWVKPLLPPRTATTGRKPRDPRQMINGILWVLRTGVPWRDLHERYGPWQTVYDHFRSWRKQGVYGRILQALHIRLDRQGKIDWDLWCIDGSNVRAARVAAGADKKAPSGTQTSPPTTAWAARAADSQANSTWLLMATACR